MSFILRANFFLYLCESTWAVTCQNCLPNRGFSLWQFCRFSRLILYTYFDFFSDIKRVQYWTGFIQLFSILRFIILWMAKELSQLLSFPINPNLLICRTFAGLGIRSSVFWANCSFFAKKWANKRFAQKNEQVSDFLNKNEQFAHLSWATWANPSFVMSDLSHSLTVPHLSWATWAIRSQSLNCLERSEPIPYSRSFDLSEMRKWAMSEFPALAFLLYSTVVVKKL